MNILVIDKKDWFAWVKCIEQPEKSYYVGKISSLPDAITLADKNWPSLKPTHYMFTGDDTPTSIPSSIKRI